MSRKVRAAILAHRRVALLLSGGHVPVGGTPVRDEPGCATGSSTLASAAIKGFQPKAGNRPPDDGPGSPPGPDATAGNHPEPTEPETDAMPRPGRRNRNAGVDFGGEKRSNVTHASTPDPDARLCRKSPGTGAMPDFTGHALMENRPGLIVQGDLTRANGHAERRGVRHHPPAFPRIDPATDTRGGQGP